MADPFSVSGTAVGIVSLGLEVCRSIVEYYSQWKDYDFDIKSTHEMIMHLQNTLKLLENKLKTDNLTGNAIVRQVESIIGACEESIHKLQKRVEKIRSVKPNSIQPVTPPATRSEKLKTGLTSATAHLQLQGQRVLYPFRQGTLGKLRDATAELRSQLQPALLLLNLDITVETLSAIQELKGERQAWRAEKDNQKILTWLSSLDFTARHHSVLTKHYPDTVSWFLESQSFNDWAQARSKVPPGLWCRGQMGCGKSVLAATVIQYLETQCGYGETVVYVYCDWQDARGQSVIGLLGSLIRQCVESCSVIPPEIRECYINHKNGKLPLEESGILALLEGVCKLLSKIYVVVDGLDECACNDGKMSGASRMVAFEAALGAWLTNISRSRSGIIQLLVTSRFDPQNAMKDKFEKVEIRATESDLRNMVLGALADNDWMSSWASPELGLAVQGDNDLQERIAQLCIDRADGMFLIAQLYIVHLKSMLNGRQLHNAMADPPEDLASSINACIQRINHQNANMRQLGLTILMWMCCSFRPLQVCELQHALNIEIGDNDFVEEGIYPVNILVASCAGLVVIEPITEVIRLVNFSIKEHLDHTDIYGMSLIESHQLITKFCATYLSFDCFEPVEQENEELPARWTQTSFHITQEMVDTWFTKYPFLRYAARYWSEHVIVATETDVAERICELLSRDSKATFLHVVFYASVWTSMETCPASIKGLHVAACRGLSEITSLLLNSKNDGTRSRTVDCTDLFGRTPLWLAAACGHANIVSGLLAAAANVSGRLTCWLRPAKKWWLPAWARDDSSAEELEVAAEGGYHQIVSQLLIAGGSFAGGIGVHGGPLEAAIFKGHRNIVEMMIDAKAPMTSAAVQAAVYGGNQEIFQIVLDFVVANQTSIWSYNAQQGKFGFTRSPSSKKKVLGMALYAAALANRIRIVKLLFEYGIDINMVTEGFHGTALAAASAHGYGEMVQLLLDRGADVNLSLPEREVRCVGLRGAEEEVFGHGNSPPWSPGSHKTALQAAAFAGHADVVRILLKHGADVNAAPGYFGTALQTSSISGNMEIVSMLLDHNACLNTACGIYGNPAQAAAFNGHSSILQKLISAGADVDLQGGRYGYSIVAAAAAGNLDCLLILIDANANVNSATRHAGCALHAASRIDNESSQLRDKYDLYREFYWSYAELKKLDSYVTTELEDFIKFTEHPRSFLCYQQRYLFGHFTGQAARDLFLPDASRLITEPVCRAQNHGGPACTRALLEHGADPNITDDLVEPPLFSAVSKGNLNTVKELVNGGANASIIWPTPTNLAQYLSQVAQDSSVYVPTDEDGPMRLKPTTALGIAVMMGNIAITKYFLDQKTEVNCHNLPGGRTLLHLCCDSSMMALLIENGAIVDHPNQWGSTALHYCARYGSADMVRQLLDAGASVSVSNNDGSTPLHEAINSFHDPETSRSEHEDLRGKIELLLNAGADPTICNNRHETPIDLCDSSNREVLFMLFQNGGDTAARF